MASHLEEHGVENSDSFPDDRRMQLYGNFFFILQSEPRHIATLCRLVSLSEIDTLLQTVMFTLYGNQYESREEHLLLTMFQVRKILVINNCKHSNLMKNRMYWLLNLKHLQSLVRYYVQIHPFLE